MPRRPIDDYDSSPNEENPDDSNPEAKKKKTKRDLELELLEKKIEALKISNEKNRLANKEKQYRLLKKGVK